MGVMESAQRAHGAFRKCSRLCRLSSATQRHLSVSSAVTNFLRPNSAPTTSHFRDKDSNATPSGRHLPLSRRLAFATVKSSAISTNKPSPTAQLCHRWNACVRESRALQASQPAASQPRVIVTAGLPSLSGQLPKCSTRPHHKTCGPTRKSTLTSHLSASTSSASITRAIQTNTSA